MVYTEPYKHGTVVGEQFKRLIELSAGAIKKEKGDDDFILVIAGTAGSGKSSLGLHTYSILDPNADVSNIALTQMDLAKCFKAMGSYDGFRYIQYDEGKLNRRDWNSEWSKDLLSMYHDIRGKNIYHVWCTAMPNLIDREFIDARLKGFVFVYSKGKFLRRFLYFTKNDLLRFMDANDNKLSIKLLSKHGASFARLDSYFLRYQGVLWTAYQEKKEERMDERIDEFYDKYAKVAHSLKTFSKEIKVNEKTVNRWFEWGLENKVLKEDNDFILTPIGEIRLTEAGKKNLSLVLKTYAGRRKSTASGLLSQNVNLFNAREGETE